MKSSTVDKKTKSKTKKRTSSNKKNQANHQEQESLTINPLNISILTYTEIPEHTVKIQDPRNTPEYARHNQTLNQFSNLSLNASIQEAIETKIDLPLSELDDIEQNWQEEKNLSRKKKSFEQKLEEKSERIQQDLLKNKQEIIKTKYGDSSNLTKLLFKAFYKELLSNPLSIFLILALFATLIITAKVNSKVKATYNDLAKEISQTRLLENENRLLTIELTVLTSRPELLNFNQKFLKFIPVNESEDLAVIIPYALSPQKYKSKITSTFTLPLHFQFNGK